MSLFITASRLKRFFALGLFLAFQSSLAVAAMAEDVTPQQIYNLAQERNGRAMETVRNQINVMDENGNTALCLAQQNQDRESFKMLLVYGASKDVECYDDKDPICAIIVGEKLKVSGAGWLLGAAATAGAIYGINELLDDDDSCPSGYSKRYPNVASCGTTGAAGWVYEQHWKHKKCGKCTPKTYDTGCTTLWQSVNDCGEHPDGWNFESSGYSGDEVCGICSPKNCPTLAETPTSVGASTFYHTPGHCPTREYMTPANVVQVAYSGEKPCYRCDYTCDEINGFATINPCQLNSVGSVAYECVRDAATQCYYRKGPAQCPVETSKNVVGSDPRFTNVDYCPGRRNMKVTGVTQKGWSGEYGCFSCHYECDETKGFSNKSVCETNTSSQNGYICTEDTETGCYYRSRTPNPDAPDGGEKECPEGFSTDYQNENDCATKGGQKDGWIWKQNGESGDWSGELKCGKCEAKTCPDGGSVAYKSVGDCLPISYKVAVAVNPVGYSGAETCNECIYYCDPNQRAFISAEICETNAAGALCEYIDGCYVVKDDCPEDYHTYIQNCNNKLHPEGWERHEKGESHGQKCYKCIEKECIPANVPDVKACGASGDKGWYLKANGYSGNNECNICERRNCNSGYVTESECVGSSAVNANWLQNDAGGYHGDLACGICTKTCNVDGNKYFNSEEECLNKIVDATEVQCVRETETDDECWSIQNITCSGGYSRTSYKDKSECPIYAKVTALSPSLGDNVELLVDHEFSDGTRCTLCNFNCEPIENDKKEESHLTSSDSYCAENKGWSSTYIQAGCYWCAVKACATEDQYTNLTIIDCVTDKGGNNSSWEIINVQDSFSGGQQCQTCGAVNCTRQGSGVGAGNCSLEKRKDTGLENGEEISGIYTGSAQCHICLCRDTSLTADSDCADGTKAQLSKTSYGVENCYYCPTAARSLSAQRDVVNNQTLIIHHTEGDYAGNTTINALATAPVVDEETGEVYGGSAEGSITLYNSASNATVSLQSGARDIYNAQALGEEDADSVSAKGTLNLIMEKGAENTTAAAISSGADAYNAYAYNNASATGLIDITDTEAATNVIYGIQARRNAYNAFIDGESATAFGQININTATDKAAYGMYAGENIYNQAAPNQTSIVNVTGSGKGNLYGLYSEAGSVYNSGDINVHAADGNAYGIYVNNGGGQIIDNSGNIIVASDTKTAYGIYVANGGEEGNGVTVLNSGLIDATGDANSRGIKIAANGANATVTNTGRIIVNGSLNNEDTAIDLNGATLANSGEVEFTGRQNLNALNGKVAMEKGGTFKADALSGDMHIAQSVVKEGFQDVYTEQNAVQAENAGLNIISDSAMFKGSLSGNNNGNYDVVATRRNFNEFAPNASIANYLEENYKQQRLAELYGELKAAGTDEALIDDILSSTGADFLVNLPQENLNALRNASEIIADSILTPTDEINRITSGADAYFMDADGRRGVTGYETTAATAFMYGDKRLDNKNRLGLGLSFMQMNSSYDNGADRKENFVSIFLPWLHSFTDKLRLASILNFGYGYGDYDRGSNRDANITDFVYGLTNKLVYSINLADFAELEPALVLNAIGYYQDEMDEGDLVVKGGNHLSVEAGVGAYLKKELMNSKYGKLTARLGGMYYRELADPYHRMRAGFKSGVGSYSINDFADIYNRDRAVLSAMLDYEYKRIALYLKYHQLLQRNKAQNFDAGIRYNF